VGGGLESRWSLVLPWRPVPAAPTVRRLARDLVRRRSRVTALGSCLLAVAACRVSSHPTEPFTPPGAGAAPADWDAVLAAPVDVEVQAVVSARWATNRKGLVDLNHPVAQEAGLKNEEVPIVLLVGVIRHPTAGDFVVDTGVSEELVARDRKGAVRGLAFAVAKPMEPLESLAGLVARHRLHVSGVLLTHSHFDHVLGLPDLAPEVPIYVGPGELRQRRKFNTLLRPTFRRLFDGRDPVREIDPARTIALDPFPAVVDLVGDGSIWGIVCEGHTKGSMAWLVNSTDGPALFVGDTSHTRWGWDHGVPPGTFTSDHELNAVALDRLREFVQQHPETKVYVGHEL
jgi:N-acyl homoserine lactone hydrolase